MKTHIVIHHTAHPVDVPISEIRKWHVDGNGWKDVGYNYYIRQSGEIEVGRMEHEIGAHCIADRMNHRGIGICLSGDFTKTYPNDNQLSSLRKLVQSLILRHDIKEVLGHRDVKGASTLCPGFDVKECLLVETGRSYGI